MDTGSIQHEGGGGDSRSMNLIIHLYLAPRFQNEWSFTPTPPTDLRRVQKDLTSRLTPFQAYTHIKAPFYQTHNFRNP